MKQTAVEFLEDALHGFIHPEHGKDFLPILNQAKQMEKEQIIKACKYGNNFEQGDLRCEVYYNETYRKDE